MSGREKAVKALYFAAVFCIMYVYFVQIHPLVVYNADDWTYIGSMRQGAYPQWGAWNPTRVLPEVLMPLCGSVAAHFVYPLTGDYLRSITLVAGGVVSLFTAIYMYMFGKVLERKRGLPLSRSLLLTTLLFVLHFLALRSGQEGNMHLFYSYSLTCYFNYFIPNVLNCILVLYLILDDALADGWDRLRRGYYSRHAVRYGFLAAAMYFALFSHLYCSAILAAYIGGQLLMELIKLPGRKTTLRACLRANCLRLGFILCWCAVQIFEMNGGRADMLADEDASALELIGQTARALWGFRTSLNRVFVLLTALTVLAAAAVFFLGRRKNRGAVKDSAGLRQLCLLCLQGGLLLVYLVLVCSRAAISGVTRPDVLFGAFFYGLLAAAMCAAFLMERAPVSALGLPVLIAVLFFQIDTGGRTFLDSTTGYVHPTVCAAVCEDVIDQFVQADEAGMTQMVLFVPQYDTADNWPYSVAFCGERISNTLYEHGVITRHIEVVQSVATYTKNDLLQP